MINVKYRFSEKLMNNKKSSRTDMVMRVLEIDAGRITDWDSFHRYFMELMGFPPSYGMNMDSWIECMSGMDRPESKLTRITVKPGETLTIKLFNAADFKLRCPDQLQALLESAAYLNMRNIENDSNTVISVAMY